MDKKTQIKVTIGICARNCQNSIMQICESISKQDFPHENMEIIFAEEGSTDKTLDAIRQFAPRSHINYKLFHQEWTGLGFSRNLILKEAQGNYIVWVDDGTIIPKDYVRKNIEFMEEHSEVGIARGFIGQYSGLNRIALLENMGQLAFNRKYVGKPVTQLPATGGSVYRVEAARIVGGFDEAIQGASEDIDIAYRILSAGWQIYITKVKFSIEHHESLQKVMKKCFWYGYGTHFTLHKHSALIEILYKSNPIAGFIGGLRVFSSTYDQTLKKIAILLPFYYFLKKTIWILGYMKSDIDAYGHE